MSTTNAPLDLGKFNLAKPAGAMAVQQILRDAGFYGGKIDGAFGPKSQAALALYEAAHADLHQGRVFLGANGYQFSTYIDGEDLCANNVRATCFGGPTDRQDNGKTASGLIQRQHPDMLMVSLPMTYSHACQGSPWGHFLGWGTEVQVASATGGPVLTATLQDVGPAASTARNGLSANAVDCNNALARKLSGRVNDFNPNAFAMQVNVRVLGGAKRF